MGIEESRLWHLIHSPRPAPAKCEEHRCVACVRNVDDRRVGRKRRESTSHPVGCGLVDEVKLGQDHEVSGTNLRLERVGEIRISEPGFAPFGVHQDHDAIETEPCSLAPRGKTFRLGDATELDQEVVWRLRSSPDLIECCTETIDQAATHAPIGELDRVSRTLLDEGRIDVDLPHVVHHHGDRAIGGGQHLVDQGGLPRSQIAADEGQRHTPTVPRKKLRFSVHPSKATERFAARTCLMQRSLQVFLSGRLIGTLAEPRTNKFTFSYDADATDLVSVRLPWDEDRYPPAALAPLIDSLAPPEPRRLELAEIHDIPDHLLFRFLEICGGDLPGALTFAPSEAITADHSPSAINPEALVDEMAVVRLDDGWGIPAPGQPSSHVLRIEDEFLPGSAAAEVFALRLAADIGLPTVGATLTSVFDIPAIVVARPDRSVDEAGAIQRHHLELFGSLCGLALEGDDDRVYEERGGPGFSEIAEALDAFAADPQAAVRTLVDHMVLHFCVGNTNAHANAYSLLEPQLVLGPIHTLLPAEIYTELVTEEGTFDIDHRLAMTIGGCATSDEVTTGALIAEAASWPRLRHSSAEVAVHDAVERVAAARQRNTIDIAQVPGGLLELIDERVVRLHGTG